MKKIIVSLFLGLFVSVSMFSVVLAENGSGSDDTKEEIRAEIEAKRKEIRERNEARKKAAKERLASRSAARKEKLEANKLRICERRKSNITNRANKLAQRAERHFNKFSQITERVDKFYTEKVVPEGVVVENYAELKQDIETQKALVEEAIDSMKAKIETFDCSAEDPKGHLEDFKAEVRNVFESLKDYRTSIRNFIKAVKTAVGEKREATTSATVEVE